MQVCSTAFFLDHEIVNYMSTVLCQALTSKQLGAG